MTLVGGLALWFAKRAADRNRLQLRYFSAAEFGPYWPLMSVELLQKLDQFRHELGYPVQISPAFGAIGRPVIGEPDAAAESGADKSYHNYLIHGEVMAVDVMPVPKHGAATRAERERWLEVAQRVGFRGFGVYPGWKPRAGIHLDVRPVSALKPGQSMATWSGIRNPETGKQEYLSVTAGLV